MAAVQALYQMETSGAGVEDVVREFAEHRFGADVEGLDLSQTDQAFFAKLVRGVVAEQDRIDAAVSGALAADWRLERIDATARAILRAGAFEMRERRGLPLEMILDEYVLIARSFFAGREAGFVNGALDRMARASAGEAG